MTRTSCLRGSLLLAALMVAAVAYAAEWAAGITYTTGTLVTYQGPTYKCLQTHTSQVGWEPPNVGALWALQQGGTATPTTPQTSTPTSTAPTATPSPTTPTATPPPSTTPTPTTATSTPTATNA